MCFYRWFVQPTQPTVCVAHSELHNVLEVFMWCGVVWCGVVGWGGGPGFRS